MVTRTIELVAASATLPPGRRRPPDTFLIGWQNPHPKSALATWVMPPRLSRGPGGKQLSDTTEQHGDRDGKAGEETSACNGQQFRNRRRRCPCLRARGRRRRH